MRVLVSGSHGLIGSALVSALRETGHEAIRLVRAELPYGEPAARWDPAAGTMETEGLDGLNAAVHLAGENLAAGRWTDERKARIRSSRVQGTRLFCEQLAALSAPPKVIACASAIGYYGDRGDEELTEESPPGKGFLAALCREWEAATEPAVQAGIRVVNLRFGMVMSAHGGALAKILPLFRLGFGGVLGSGRQYMSWVVLDDAVGAIMHVIMADETRGPVNVVAPQAVTNREFTKALGRVLRRPAFLRVPAFALRVLFGQMAEETLLASARVRPTRLLASGYQFQHPELEGALRALLR